MQQKGNRNSYGEKCKSGTKSHYKKYLAFDQYRELYRGKNKNIQTLRFLKY